MVPNKRDDHRAGKIVVELNGRINKCGVISPRYDLSHHDIEEWVGRLLPSRLFGTIVMTTSSGIMDHEEARRRKVGGKVLGFFLLISRGGLILKERKSTREMHLHNRREKLA